MSGFADLSEPVRVLGAIAVSFLVTSAVVPYVRRLAIRTSFYDEPVGYKEHPAPTPYLGGVAVMAGFSVAAIAFGSALDEYAALFLCALALCAVGTIDDRVGLGVLPRLGAQVAVAVVIWSTDLGWNFLGDAGDLALTTFWIVGLINAFNLMDNLDGATGTVAAISAAGVGVLALIESQPLLAALSFSVSGACAAFLRANLAKPSRIFLGDGGSMAIGLLIAVAVTALPERSLGLEDLFALVPIVGLVVLDTTLVVISRTRRGAPILSGGRDHLTHRLLRWAGSPQAVALILAVSQALLCGLAVALHDVGESVIGIVAASYVAIGLTVIAALELPAVRASRSEPAEQRA